MKHLWLGMVLDLLAGMCINVSGQTFATAESFYADTRAHRVGDIITIHIIEYSQGSNETNSRTRKDSQIGMNTKGSGPLGFLPIGGFGLNNNVDFNGQGESNRKGSLRGKMTARITSVDENGNFVIKGNREIIVNNEKQMMVLDGIIRPEDISKQNIILSYQIADAKISYNGSGPTMRSQKSGWITRIFNWLF